MSFNQDNKSAFTFGSNPSGTTPATGTTTKAFGSALTNPTSSAFTFGGTQPASGANAQPGFSASGFGQNNAAFGSTQADATKPAAFSFGGAPASAGGAFSFGATSSNTQTAASSNQPPEAKPSTGFSFGSSTATKPSEQKLFAFGTNAGASSGFSFGTPATPSVKQAAQAQAPATQGPLSLSALKTPVPTSGVTVPSTPTPSSGTVGKNAAVPTTTASTTSFAFGGTNKTEPLKDASSQEKEGVQKQEVEVLTTLKGKNLAEILSDWQSDLHQTTNAFHTKASEIAQLDNQLLELSDLVYRLVVESTSLSSKQSELVQVLDFVEGQQSALDRELDKFEEKLTAMVKEGIGASVQNIDNGVAPEQTRERTYELAEQLSKEGGALNEKLNQLAIFVNQQQGNHSKDDAMSLITKILNEHYNSLVWIDTTATSVGKKLNMAKKYADVAQTDLKHAQLRMK